MEEGDWWFGLILSIPSLLQNVNMKYLILNILAVVFIVPCVSAQYIQLIPITRYDPVNKVILPDYAKAIRQLNTELNKLAENICQKELDKQLEEKILAASKQVSVQTTYTGVVNYTSKIECEIEDFRPLRSGEKPAVIHSPDAKVSVFTIEIYPFVDVTKNLYSHWGIIIREGTGACDPTYFKDHIEFITLKGVNYEQVNSNIKIYLSDKNNKDYKSPFNGSQILKGAYLGIWTVEKKLLGWNCSVKQYFVRAANSQKELDELMEKDYKIYYGNESKVISKEYKVF
jgi:hypothetical protein